MTNYVKKIKGRSVRAMAFSAFWLLLLAVVFLGVLLMMLVPKDDTLYESYQDFSQNKNRAFHLRLDGYDWVDYVVEERTLGDHYVLFMHQEDGSMFNVILDEKKAMKFGEDGVLNTVVYKLGSDDASDYRDGIIQHFRGQDLSAEEMSYLNELASSAYYTTPFNKGSNLLILAMGAFFAVLFVVTLARAIIAGRGGGSYRKDLVFIATSTGRSPEEVEQDVNASFNDPNKAPYAIKNMVCNEDYILAKSTRATRLMRPSDVVWMYRHTVTRRTYGIKTGSSHSVMLYSQDSHEPCQVACRKEDEADRTLFELQKRCPMSFVGYDADMIKQAKKNNYHALVTAWNSQQTHASTAYDSASSPAEAKPATPLGREQDSI